MSKNEESHSVWAENISTSVQVWTLFSGFIFTAITILLTLLPDPSQIPSQLTLFLFAVMFDLLLYVIYSYQNALNDCVWIAPPLPRRMLKSRYDMLDNLLYVLLGAAIIVMFLVWNLVYLAFASGIVFVLFMILGYILVYQPFQRTRQKFEANTKEKWRIRKFSDNRDSVVESED